MDSGVTQVQTEDGSAVHSTTPFSSPFYQYGSSIQTMTNPKMQLDELELFFKGMRKDRRGNLVMVSEPLMNEFGISRVMGIIHSVVNRITIMSNIEKADLSTLMSMFSDAVIQDMMQNRRKYIVKTLVDATIILTEAQNVVFVCLKRGYEEGDRRFWKGSISETRITQDKARQQSFLSMLNPFHKEQ